MKTGASLKNRQGGAIAVVVGISIVLLVGFLAMVIDLGHLYIAKTELQNAADAAALSGAKQLNGTRLGVSDTSTNNGAVQWAIAMAAKNNYDFSSKPVDITIADIWVGDCPDDSCMVAASSITTDAAAADKTFLKVHTQDRNLTAWFAPIWNIFHISTFGMAVAGKYTVDVSPVGICQLPDDLTNPNIIHSPNPGFEFGFERGVAYKVSDANPLGPGTMFWIDPVEMAPTPCVTSNGSASNTLPYICTGKVSFTPIPGSSIVYTNTGVSDNQLEALDSRFDVIDSKNKCDAATAPPDTNIKQYRYTDSTAGSPSKWMKTDPVRQSMRFTTIGGKFQPVPWSSRTFADYGVLWSASRPTVAAGDATDAAVSARWGSIPTTQGVYHAGPGEATLYPQPSPYAQGSGDFFQPPGNPATAKANRRVLNIVIIDCTTAGGVCRPAPVLAIGRFIMQRKANIPSDKDIYIEFAGLLSPTNPTGSIKLYR